MNKQRRNKLATIKANLDGIATELQSVCDEEQEYIDNAPENLAFSDRYAVAEEICELLSECCDKLYEVGEDIDNAISM